MEHFVKALQKPVMLKVLLCLLLLFDHHRLAVASSGGVMGGSDFSSFSDSSKSATDSWFSSKSGSSYNTYSSRRDSPDNSYSSASDSSFSSRRDSPYNSYSSRRDSPDNSYSNRKDSPVTSYSSASDSSFSSRKDSPDNSYSSRRDSSYSSHSRSPRYYSDNNYSSNHVHPTPSISSTEIFLIMCFVAVFLMCCYLNHRRRDHEKDTSFKTSVFKLQVGLLGTARSLQMDLNEIAKTTNTSTSDGFRHILKATIGALLQHPDYFTFGYSCVENGSSVQQAEKQFQKLSFDERSKFDEETLVNLKNVIKQSGTSPRASECTVVDMGSKFDEEPLINVENVRKRNATSQMFEGVSCNEYIVVTIIVAACGLHQLPPVKSNAELKKALQTLASLPSSKIMASVVLWTPQKKDDTLSVQELRKNYPLLYPL